MNYPPQQPQGPQGPMGPMMGPPLNKGKATASMVTGILSLVFCWLSIFIYTGIIPIALGIVAVVLGVQARKELPQGQSGSATAGMVCGIIGLALSIFWVSCVICVAAGCAGVGSVASSSWMW